MISRLTGQLFEKSPPRIGLDVGGVGYELEVSMTTFYDLPEIGREVTLLTHLVIREDAHLLFGFGTADERRAFRELIKVTGIGARTALAILSSMSVNDLAQAITQQESARMIKAPGIGKKTAERLLLELRGKLGADLGNTINIASNHHSDILQALTGLGYSEKESALALKNVPPDTAVSDGIKLALKHLSR